MNQQPDNFFREKLADYHKPAPMAAWERIEASLERPENKFAWWKIAASLTLFAGLSLSVWVYTRTSEVQTVTANVKKAEPADSHNNNAPIDNAKKDQVAEPEVKREQPPVIAKGITAKNIKRSKSANAKEPSTPTVATALQEENLQPAETILSEAKTENAEGAVASEKKYSSKTLIMSVEETDKYLDKSALAEATLKEERSSTFKKLLKKANDLTTNQDPFGDLREKKNEILALNFKNEKRGQNK